MADLVTTLLSLTSLISPLLLFIASCYYLSKVGRPDAILLCIGSAIGLLVSAFFIFLPRFIQSHNMSYSDVSPYYSIAGVISFFGGMCFVAGFFMLIINAVSAYKQQKVFKGINDADRKW